MSCDRAPISSAETIASLTRAQDRADVLLQFAEGDIKTLWENCRFLGYTDDEIRAAIRDLAERLAGSARS